MSGGHSGDMLTRGKGSRVGNGGTFGGGRDSGNSGAEKPPEEAGSKDLEINAVLASWVPDDVFKTGVVDVSAGVDEGTVDEIPPMSSSGATYDVVRLCCLWLSTEVVSGRGVATPSWEILSEDGELEWPRKVAVGRSGLSPISLVVDGSGGEGSPVMMFVSSASRRLVPLRSVNR